MCCLWWTVPLISILSLHNIPGSCRLLSSFKDYPPPRLKINAVYSALCGNISQVRVSSFHAERSVLIGEEVQADRYIFQEEYKHLDASVLCLEKLWLMNGIILVPSYIIFTHERRRNVLACWSRFIYFKFSGNSHETLSWWNCSELSSSDRKSGHVYIERGRPKVWSLTKAKLLLGQLTTEDAVAVLAHLLVTYWVTYWVTSEKTAGQNPSAPSSFWNVHIQQM